MSPVLLQLWVEEQLLQRGAHTSVKVSCVECSRSVRLGWNRPCLSSPSPSVNGVHYFKLKLQQLFVMSVLPTTHAPHMSTLIPYNTERCGLVTVWSVQEA